MLPRFVARYIRLCRIRYSAQIARSRRPRRRPGGVSVEQLEARSLLSGITSSLVSITSPNAGVDVVNGEPTTEFSSVGIIGSDGAGFCTGTLIDANHVLTAAHCVDTLGDTDGTFTVGGKSYATSEIFVHRKWNPKKLGTGKANDIAIMRLDESVTDVAPSPLNRLAPRVGQELTLVGFGGGGTGDSGHTGDFGTKRVGTTSIDKVSKTLIEWDFDDNTESNTAPGDSGGPAFIEGEGIHFITGVTSGGLQANAGLGDHSFDTRVDIYANWIESIVGTLPPAVPAPDSGPAPPPGNNTDVDDHPNQPGSGISAIALGAGGSATATGTIETIGDRDVFAVAVTSPGTLTVTLSETDGAFDPFLRFMSPDGDVLAADDNSGGGTAASVAVDVTVGTWFVSAAARSDSHTGDYSVAVAFEQTVIVEPDADAVVYYFSTANAATLISSDGSRLSVEDTDIVELITAPGGEHTFRLYFDGSDVGLSGASADIDAFTLTSTGHLLMSVASGAKVGGIKAKGEDVLRFAPTSLGESTRGSWSLYLDGSDVGLRGKSASIDALTLLDDGRILMSTSGSVAVESLRAADNDVFAFAPTATGDETAGTFFPYFDASRSSLSPATTGIDALFAAADGSLHFSSHDSFLTDEVGGGRSDIAMFIPTGFGADSSGFFGADLTLEGHLLGLTGADIDAIHIGGHEVDAPSGGGVGGTPTGTGGTTDPTAAFSILIRYLDNGLNAAQQAIFNQAANRWSSIITADVPDVTVGGVAVDDLMIDVTVPFIDGEFGILGQAGPVEIRPGILIPSTGLMQFDRADITRMQQDGSLQDVILHEMGHVLGLGTLWQDKQLLVTSGGTTSYIGLQALAEYKAAVDSKATSIPVENDGGPGTAGAHWEEDILDNELMTGFLNSGSNPLSPITIGALADLGYQVDLSQADTFLVAPASFKAANSVNATAFDSALREFDQGLFNQGGKQKKGRRRDRSRRSSNAALQTNMADIVDNGALRAVQLTTVTQFHNADPFSREAVRANRPSGLDAAFEMLGNLLD